MKKLCILLLCLFLSSTMSSQNEPRAFIGVAQDIKMTFNGPHQSGGTLNLEVEGGVKFGNARVSTKFEWLDQIDYQKWTIPAIDIRVINIWEEEVEIYLGAELSTIYRKDNFDDGRHTGVYTGPDGNWSVGGNLNVIWNFSDYFAFNYNVNVFTAEKWDNYGNEMDPIRWDTRFGLVFYFPN